MSLILLTSRWQRCQRGCESETVSSTRKYLNWPSLQQPLASDRLCLLLRNLLKGAMISSFIPGRCEAAVGVASEEWEEEDDTSSLMEEIAPTLSPLFGRLLLVVVGFLGVRSRDERGLAWGDFFKSLFTDFRIWLKEKCVTSEFSGFEVKESEEYRSDTWR